ncbi:hypothetical protein JKF63_06997 [Porcisia hertigi]|uniref:Uncharacterized protein n=1 Tax=Porcisia hertigi TaxID=2761500 RepID=A0A836I2D5_9TRYP|nr:hypothetical protein JKF63_06997 [Porcisia hertigi]
MEVDLRHRGLQSFDPAEFANTDEHLQLLLQVRQLDLSYNSLYNIRGLEGLTHLTVLNISHNGLRSLSGGLPLTLRKLDASHNSLVSLQNAALLPLESLTSLNIAFNDLEDLRGVPNVTAQLTYLDVRSNRLTSLMGIEHCSHLHELHAEANLLREAADVASIKSLPHLKAVFLSGNPLFLRKRQLAKLYILLPSSVEQDDLPTTAPPSSVRSSTAAPPSVPDTSSVSSIDRSTVASVADFREGMRRGSEQSSADRVTAPKHVHSSAATFSTTTAPALAVGVVGGAPDSSTCPRRPLPREHRLVEIPGSASMSSSPDCTHGSLTSGLLHKSDSHGLGIANHLLPPCDTSSPLGQGEGSNSDLIQEELREQLARVTAERDTYRREVVSLRRELRELRQGNTQQWEEEKAADPNRLGQPSVHHSSTPALHREGTLRSPQNKRLHTQQQEKQQRQQQGSSPANILAVEMSAHSSVCSQDGEVNNPESFNNNSDYFYNAPQHRDLVARASVYSPPLKWLNTAHNSSPTTTGSPVSLSKMSRREMAALFMAKLQNSSSR